MWWYDSERQYVYAQTADGATMTVWPVRQAAWWTP